MMYIAFGFLFEIARKRIAKKTQLLLNYYILNVCPPRMLFVPAARPTSARGCRRVQAEKAASGAYGAAREAARCAQGAASGRNHTGNP